MNGRNLIGRAAKYRTILVVCGVLVCLGLVYLWAGCPDFRELFRYIKSPGIHPAALLFAFFILPVFGFPISVLLVLLGLRFGTVGGIAAMFLIIPLHLAVSFFLARSVFGELIKKLAGEKRVQKLQVPEHRHLEFSFVFMAVPGLSYAMKNYLLPLSGVRFRYYFFIGWLVQGLMGIPFVILGKVPTDWDPGLIFVAVLIFVLIYVVMKWGQKRYRNMVKASKKKNGMKK
jgi:uncharacterized membrane protein YdjX (TVP38/TMEM64 family)